MKDNDFWPFVELVIAVSVVFLCCVVVWLVVT